MTLSQDHQIQLVIRCIECGEFKIKTFVHLNIHDENKIVCKIIILFWFGTRFKLIVNNDDDHLHHPLKYR
jgi:hypothetical protein